MSAVNLKIDGPYQLDLVFAAVQAAEAERNARWSYSEAGQKCKAERPEIFERLKAAMEQEQDKANEKLGLTVLRDVHKRLSAQHDHARLYAFENFFGGLPEPSDVMNARSWERFAEREKSLYGPIPKPLSKAKVKAGKGY